MPLTRTLMWRYQVKYGWQHEVLMLMGNNTCISKDKNWCGCSVLAGMTWHNLVPWLHGQNILKYSDCNFKKPENLLSSRIAFRPTVLPFHYHYWPMACQLKFSAVVLSVDTRQCVVWQVITSVSEIYIKNMWSLSYPEYESSLTRRPKIQFFASCLLCRQLTFLF
jgi:hypothetical protein